MKKALLFLCAILTTSCQNTAETDDYKEVKETVVLTDSTQTFDWSYGMCTYSGTFLPSEISKVTLEHTSQLCFSGVKLVSDPTILIPKLKEMTYKDYEILAFLRDMKSEFEHKEILLKKHVVETDYWENLRAIKLKELREEYGLKRTLIESYGNPKVLVNSSFSINCKKYVGPLVSNDSTQLMIAWKEIIDIQKKENGNPDDVSARFSQQQNSPQKWEFARETILLFGWYNCANEQRIYWQNDDEVQAEFARLFVKIEQSCDN